MNKYIIGIAILLILDLLWITYYMNEQYRVQVKTIQKSDMKVNGIAGVFAYLLMVLGLIVFVLPQIRKDHAFVDSLIYGFLFGIVVYGVYDFTSAAVFKDWNMSLALIDILWGGTVFFLSAYIASKLGN